MLSKLAYPALCRSVQLLALLARGDAAKDLSNQQTTDKEVRQFR